MSHVNYEQSDHVAVVTISREKALNALTADVLRDLRAALEQAASDQVRAIVLTGAGAKAFVAGADIEAMSTMSRREALAFSELGNGVFRYLETLPMPSIAAVNGYALGGGCELALACDIRLASTNAVFAQPEVGLGITAGFGGTQRLARTVGIGIAKEILYTGSRVKAPRAAEIGLVNAVYEPDQLLPEARKLASVIASQAPIAVRNTKQAISLGLNTDMDSAIATEALMFAACFESFDQREGMGAFIEKRKHEPFRDE